MASMEASKATTEPAMVLGPHGQVEGICTLGFEELARFCPLSVCRSDSHNPPLILYDVFESKEASDVFVPQRACSVMCHSCQGLGVRWRPCLLCRFDHSENVRCGRRFMNADSIIYLQDWRRSPIPGLPVQVKCLRESIQRLCWS